MTPTHTTSTLFPYTTLFRSVERADLRDVARLRVERQRGAEAARLAAAAARVAVGRNQPPGGARRAAQRPRDRKSTRLNSSHLGISYAVFCLKKKKRKKQAHK